MNKRLYLFFLFTILIALFFIERAGMFTDVATFSRANNITTIIGVLLVLSFSAIVLSRKTNRIDKVSKIITYLLLLIYLISFCYFLIDPAESRNIYGLILLPLLLYYFGRNTTQYAKSDNVIIWSLSFVFGLLSYYFLSNINREIFNQDELEYATNSSYPILYLLPFVLCHKQNIIRILSIILTLIVVMFSLKRGGFIALIVATFVYLLIYQIGIQGKRHIFFRVVMAIVIFGILFFLVNYLNENVINARLSNRFENDETGGSGRIEIYRTYWNILLNSSPWYWLVGHGWNGSMRASGLGVTCHNDFLEAIMDFGIIGLILYILLYVELIKYCRKMIKYRHPYAPAMGASIAIFFVNSMVSHILIYPRYLMLFSLFWGFMVSTSSSMTISQEKKYENRSSYLSRCM